MSILPLVLLTLASDTPPTMHWPTGNPSCPCIDAFGSSELNKGTHAPLSGARAECDIQRDGDRLCYSASYGSAGCDRYDWYSTPECSRVAESDRADYCASAWCWVDAENCDRPFGGPSFYFPNATWRGDVMRFSYETCGYLDRFQGSTGEVRSSRLYILLAAHDGPRHCIDCPSPCMQVDLIMTYIRERRPYTGGLRVAFPGDSLSGWTLVGLTASEPPLLTLPYSLPSSPSLMASPLYPHL